MDERAREENLLGSFSLAVVDRMLAASAERAGGGGEVAAGLVSAATHLQGASVEQLSRALGLTHSATVRLVDRLEASGDLARRPGGDRRSLSVVPTRRGAARAERVRSARFGVLGEMLGRLTPAERRSLASLHAKLLDGIVDSGAAPANVCRLCDADACGHHEGRCPVTMAADRHRAGP
jgi:DNA-binding MarR family transcriptional regulator